MQLLFIYPHTHYFTNPTIDYLLKELGKNPNVVLTLVIPEQKEPLTAESANLIRRVFNFQINWPKKFWKWWPIIRQYWQLLNYAKKCKIDKIIAVDPAGLIVAGRIRRYLTDVELHYFPFEILFWQELKEQRTFVKLKRLETFYVKSVDVLVIQDVVRKELFFGENGLEDNQLKVHYIPVSPVMHEVTSDSKQKFRKKLGIGDEEIILLHCGSVAKWSGAAWLIDLLKLGLPPNFKLVIHSKHKLTLNNAWQAELLRLQSQGFPVILHDDAFPEYEEYLSFINCTDYGLAFYETDPTSPYTGKNIQEIGLASGKFACFVSQGIPVIVSHARIYRELNERYAFGLVVHHVEELSRLLQKVRQLHFDTDSILSLYKNELDPEKFGKEYIKELED